MIVASADRMRLEACLDALIENAIIYTEPGDVIELCATVSGGHVGLQVRDTGAGMAAGDLETVRMRLGGDTNDDGQLGSGGRRAGGTGLGLRMVAAVAWAHGGQLQITSAPGEGTAVWMVLPAE